MAYVFLLEMPIVIYNGGFGAKSMRRSILSILIVVIIAVYYLRV